MKEQGITLIASKGFLGIIKIESLKAKKRQKSKKVKIVRKNRITMQRGEKGEGKSVSLLS
jgi:hypothetical protein